MSEYTKRFNETKDMFFFFFRKYYVLLEKYSKPVIVSNNIKKGFHGEPV